MSVLKRLHAPRAVTCGGLPLLTFCNSRGEILKMTDFSMIFVTVGSESEASKIAHTLVEEGLVACTNIVPRIRSIYRWKGEVCYDDENDC